MTNVTISFDPRDPESITYAISCLHMFEAPGRGAPPPPVISVPPPPPPPAPLAANTPPMPVPPPNPVPGVMPDIEVDRFGHPWDAAVHAGSKKKIQDGSWRRKQKVTAEMVVAHFRANPPAANPPAAPPAAPAGSLAAQLPLQTTPTWGQVMEAFARRAEKYSTDVIQTVLANVGIDPKTLHSHPEQYRLAVSTLGEKCPL